MFKEYSEPISISKADFFSVYVDFAGIVINGEDDDPTKLKVVAIASGDDDQAKLYDLYQSKYIDGHFQFLKGNEELNTTEDIKEDNIEDINEDIENKDIIPGTGLVLSGGGGKGIYQVGILKSLAEAGYLDDIVAVSGTSIGGVNAVLFAEGMAEGGIERAVKQMEEAWEDMNSKVLFDVDYNTVSAGDKHFSRNETSKLIDKYLDYSLFDENHKMISLFVTGAKCPDYINSTETITEEEVKLLTTISVEETYKDYEVTYFELNQKANDYIKSSILATTSLPVIYTPVSVEDSLYVDGGVKDNTPIKPLYDMGIRRFIVIELSKESSIKNKELYKDAEIIDILPSADLGKLLSGTLNFDKQDKAFKKYLGELDGKRYIKTLFEKDESFIAIQDRLARLDFEQAKKKVEFDNKYENLNGNLNRNFDYINKLEESLKKYDT